MAQKTTPANRSEEEIAGYRDVLTTIHASREYVKVRPGVILQLHRDLYKFSAEPGGHWKQVDNEIADVRPDETRTTRFRCVPAVLSVAYVHAVAARAGYACQATSSSPSRVFETCLSLPGVVSANLGVHSAEQIRGNVQMIKDFRPLAPEENAALLALGKDLAAKWGEHFGPVKEKKTAGSYWVEGDGLTLHVRPLGDIDPRQAEFEVTTQGHIFAPAEFGLGYVRVKGFTIQHSGNCFPRPQQGALSAMRGHHWIVVRRHVRRARGGACPFGGPRVASSARNWP